MLHDAGTLRWDAAWLGVYACTSVGAYYCCILSFSLIEVLEDYSGIDVESYY